MIDFFDALSRRPLRVAVAVVALAAACACWTPFALAQARDPAKPTIVLVHGAFADSSSWTRVAARLAVDGYAVRSIANPLRGLRQDADYVADTLTGLRGALVLVGHSYAGSVISVAAAGNTAVRALVFVSAFAPARGETAADLTARFAGSTLASALEPAVPNRTGVEDLAIRPDRFQAQFAADVPGEVAAAMSFAQRPIAASALREPADAAAWMGIPSWFVYGDRDRNIPPAALAFMAERASSRHTVVVPGGSHVVMVSNPDVVAKLVEEAAAAATSR